MRIRYWGVRGSIPVPGTRTIGVGGNTPCVSLDLADGALLILDGGTGLRNLGRKLLAREEVAAGRARATILFSHRHWDHIQGLPFFEPAYIAGNLFDVYAPKTAPPGSPLDDNVVSLQHNLVNFPVPFDQIRQAYRFHVAREDQPFDLPSARVHPVRLNHSGVTLGYAVTEPATGIKLAYLLDTAPWEEVLLGEGMAAAGPVAEVGPRYRERVVEAARNADLVIYDTFFDETGYATRKTWGHSTAAHALELCHDAGARRLHMFHFAPDLDDASVARLEARARSAAGAIEVTAAYEGLEITLP